MKRLITTLAIATTVFTGCSDDSSSSSAPTVSDLDEKIVGKWINTEIGGKKALTNQKAVVTFESNKKGTASIALGDSVWHGQTEFSYSTKDNEISYTFWDNSITKTDFKWIVESVDENNLKTTFQRSTVIDDVVEESSNELSYVRVTEDYSQSIIGLWEGSSTSKEGSTFDDGQKHRWEYLDNGTFRYYVQDEDGNWIPNPNQTKSEYFVDGPLLCTRWVIDGEENREWWEVESIKDDVMKWTALRAKGDGSTYTASFKMKKVKPLTKADIEKKMIGKWILAETDGKQALTNRKVVTDIVSTKKLRQSLSFTNRNVWLDGEEFNLTLKDNLLSWTVKNDISERVFTHEVVAITDNDMYTYLSSNMIEDGKKQSSVFSPKAVHFTRVTEDYSEDILGIWEGKITSEKSDYDDLEEHRWEFKKDGTFLFYFKEKGKWKVSDDAYADYFVEGPLLCTRWKNNGKNQQENREWWEVESIKDDVMKWTGLRADEDGSTYTATFEMKKVEE